MTTSDGKNLCFFCKFVFSCKSLCFSSCVFVFSWTAASTLLTTLKREKLIEGTRSCQGQKNGNQIHSGVIIPTTLILFLFPKVPLDKEIKQE